jgi:repressor LexA
MASNPIQDNLLAFIKGRRGNLEDLSFRDIGEEIGLGRRAQIVVHHLSQLEKRGLIRRENANAKKYILTKTPIPETIKVNLYSCPAQCGPNGLLGEDRIIDRVPLPTRTFHITNAEDFFLMKTRGKSMEPWIKEGNLALIRKQDDVDHNGQIALVVHNGVPKIKKVSIEDLDGERIVHLFSKNESFEPETVKGDDDQLKVVGIVKAIISNPV